MSPKAKAKAGAAAFDNSENQMDLTEMKIIFNKIDLDKNGTLDIDELQSAARELGVKCSKNSMRKIFKMIDTDGTGDIDFDEFFIFFGQISDPEKMKSLLSSANQAFFDYRQRVEDDPNFAKDFPFPKSANPAQKYEFNESNVERVLWAPNDQVCVVTGDGLVRIWDSSDRGKYLKPKSSTSVGKKGVYSAAGIFNNGAEKLLLGFGRKEENVMLWDMPSATCLGTISADEAAIYSCAASGARACAGSQLGNLSLIDMNRFEMTGSYEVHEGVINDLVFNDRGDVICSCAKDGNCHLLDPRSGSVVSTLEDASAGYSCNSALWVSDHEILIAGEDYCIKKWDIRDCSAPPVACYLGHTTPIKAMAMSEDRKMFASGASDGSVRMWFLDPDAIRAAAAADAPVAQAATGPTLEQLQEEYERIVDLVREGEEDPRRAKEMMERIKALEAEQAEAGCGTGSAMANMKKASHISACLDLAGHKMAIQTLAWKTASSGAAMVLTGSQDEASHYYEVDREPLLADCVNPPDPERAGSKGSASRAGSKVSAYN